MNVIGALVGKKLCNTIRTIGAVNKDIFNIWLEKTLLPNLKKGMTIIMDNASFHKSSRTRELIEKAGCRLLFLPPYSPDLNPIENVWHVVKSVRNAMQKNGFEFAKQVADAIEYVRSR